MQGHRAGDASSLVGTWEPRSREFPTHRRAYFTCRAHAGSIGSGHHWSLTCRVTVSPHLCPIFEGTLTHRSDLLEPSCVQVSAAGDLCPRNVAEALRAERC
jgi:hypothetical protein